MLLLGLERKIAPIPSAFEVVAGIVQPTHLDLMNFI